MQDQICAQSEDSEVVYTKEMEISHCIGCNYCWLKTPGICTIKDDYESILKKILRHVPRYDIRPQMGIIYTGNAEHAYPERWVERTTLNFESTSLGVFSLEEGRGILSCI